MTPPPTSNAPPTGSDKLWMVLCHLSVFFGCTLLLPLVVYLVMRKESELVATHAREALNFHLSFLIYGICTIPFIFILIGIPVLIALGLTMMICAIIAAIAASEGRYYRYPLTIRLIS